jgi:hypothetical protein
MAAVMVERPRDVSRVQDPDCRGHRVMQAWAPYRRDTALHDIPDGAKMGWKERLDVAKEAEPEWVVLVDRAISPLVKANHFYARLIKRYYLDQQSLWAVASNIERTPGFVMLYINAICSHVEERIAFDPK